MSIVVVGFDLDNTLYPVEGEMYARIRTKIYEGLACELDLPVAAAAELFEDEYNSNNTWGQSGSKTIEELGRRKDRNLDGKAIVQAGIEQADILDLIQPNPEMMETLVKIASRHGIDLISGTSYELAYAKLERVGIDKRVFKYISADKSKRDGEVYKHWIEQRGTLPEQMLYVGDNKTQDIDVPNALDIRTCFVGEKSYDAADYHVQSVLELSDILNDSESSK